jgi:hypothetical protein
VIERLESILAEPAVAPMADPAPPTTRPESDPEAESPPVVVASAQPEPVPATPTPTTTPAPEPARPVFPQITLTSVKPSRRRWYLPLGALALAVVGVGLLALAAVWGVQPKTAHVMGVAPGTAGFATGLIGVICLGVAAYMILDRLGQPRERRFE